MVHGGDPPTYWGPITQSHAQRSACLPLSDGPQNQSFAHPVRPQESPPMRLLRLAALCSTALAFASVSPSFAATTIEQEFRYEAGRLKLDRQGDATTIAFRGGAPDLAPGRPEMPLLAEPVTLPPGMSISAVHVIALETEPVADNVRLATTAV